MNAFITHPNISIVQNLKETIKKRATEGCSVLDLFVLIKLNMLLYFEIH